VQSESVEHVWPLTHAGHVPPPQSVPVSAPFFTLSVQVGAWQIPAVHTSD
jgi:hypothetical protein